MRTGRVSPATYSASKSLRAEDYREPGMPQGGCWERLIAISEYVKSDYVIQIDADTVSLSAHARGGKCCRRGQFLCPGYGRRAAPDFLRRSGPVGQGPGRIGRTYPDSGGSQSGSPAQVRSTARYVRGCAGFSGFAPGCFSRSQLRRVQPDHERHSRRSMDSLGNRAVQFQFHGFEFSSRKCIAASQILSSRT
jgi:hypothetical protein